MTSKKKKVELTYEETLGLRKGCEILAWAYVDRREMVAIVKTPGGQIYTMIWERDRRNPVYTVQLPVYSLPKQTKLKKTK